MDAGADVPSFLDFAADDHDDALDFLRAGEMRVLGRLAGSSNATLAVEVTHGPDRGLAVYKPAAGERPLHDFPHGSLPHREVATYWLSEALGWHLVPPTLLRADAPFGEGSLQLFVPHDPEVHAFVLFEEVPDEFRQIVVLDVLANNADRKAGHVVRDLRTGRLWAIDNGLTFHVDPKLRTVLWPFAGEQLEDALVEAIAALDLDRVHADLAPLLSDDELHAFDARVHALLADRRYPLEPEDRYAYPWPPV